MFTVRFQLTEEGGERWVARDAELLGVWKDFSFHLMFDKSTSMVQQGHMINGSSKVWLSPPVCPARSSAAGDLQARRGQQRHHSWRRGAGDEQGQPSASLESETSPETFSPQRHARAGNSLLERATTSLLTWQACRAPLSPVKVCWLRNTDRLQKEHGAEHSVADLPQRIPKPSSSLSLKYNSLNMWLWASPPYLASAGVFTTHYLLKLTWDSSAQRPWMIACEWTLGTSSSLTSFISTTHHYFSVVFWSNRPM